MNYLFSLLGVDYRNLDGLAVFTMELCRAESVLIPCFPVPQCRVEFERYREGAELFNRAEFFEAHEVLEDIWRAAPLADKKVKVVLKPRGD